MKTESGELRLDVVVSAPFAENTWIVWKDGGKGCVIVDPGFDPRSVERLVERLGLEPELILLTHGHVDHIAGNGALRKTWPKLPIAVGETEAPMLTDARLNLSFLSGVEVVSPPADRLLREGEVVESAGLRFKVLDLPGHSPGHVVYVVGDDDPHTVIGGDVLFAGSIGRTDFPGGDHALLIKGIRDKLYVLPDGCRVYPGHGEATTIGAERRSNPYVRG